MFKVKVPAVAVMAAMTWFAAFGDAPKYVFLFIGDGMSVPQRMTAEEFSRKSGAGSLAMNSLPFSAMTRTCSADSLVTDSSRPRPGATGEVKVTSSAPKKVSKPKKGSAK